MLTVIVSVFMTAGTSATAAMRLNAVAIAMSTTAHAASELCGRGGT